ncbi:hypothetical protein [Microbacterium candidum]|uniref:Holin n=1 Tax=Microbacterium candidum TaxID=3041922 RepID=A0ABT7MWQ5_9MICO|nr:hypothetical protein [Microbacterium sp. ASV49]MDL9978855.1 hypothetical protein [Microbacterium sp. ASV49]
MKRILNPKVRRWLYGVSIAGLGVAVFYDLLPPESLAVWVPLVVALLNVPKEGGPPTDAG